MLASAWYILSILVICISSKNFAFARPLDSSPTPVTTLNVGMSMFELHSASRSDQVQTTELIFASRSAS
jgi:hypothetical protein